MNSSNDSPQMWLHRLARCLQERNPALWQPETSGPILSLTEAGANQIAEYSRYRDDPVGFARDVLGVSWTPAVVRVAEAMQRPPYRVLIPSGHSQGKTHGVAGLAIWWFCTRSPALVISTAPKLSQLKDLLWKEIRRQVSAARKPIPVPFTGPASLRAERSAWDFMAGYTARDSTSFQGHHGPNKLFIFDEAIGVAPEFWSATQGMFDGEGDAWLCPFNPTDTTTAAYREYQSATKSNRVVGGWSVVRMSAVDHPNIAAELRGEPPVVQSAMRLETFERLLKEWSTLVGTTEEPKATDLQWPPVWAKEYCERTGQQPRWYRPGPLADSRLLARFPVQAATAVWGEGDWQAACRVELGLPVLELPIGVLPEIGCDVARFGDDNTGIHVRCGGVSLYHEEYNGQSIPHTVGRIKEVCRVWCEWANRRRPRPVKPTDIPIKIDDSGVGGGVTDILMEDGYSVAGVNSATCAIETRNYALRRDELWFTVAQMARAGELDLSRLPAETLEGLRVEAMGIKYRLNSKGQRVVQPKDVTKEEIGRSPDGMDALNLAYCFVEGLGDAIGGMPSVGAIKSR